MNKKITLIVLLSIVLSSCQRGCQNFKRRTGTSREYNIKMYSGGNAVYEDNFKGVVNEESGNGCFYYKGDTLVELSGDYILKSVK